MSSQSGAYAANWKRGAFQLVTTLPPFLLLLALMARWSGLPHHPGLLLAIPAAGLLVRLFIIQHDCGHGSFFRSRRANDVLGRMLGLLTLTPYSAWKKDHAAHHASNGNLDRRGHGDVTTLTVAEYGALSPWGRLGYRLYRNPLVMVLVGAPVNFILLQRFAVGQSLRDRGMWRSILALDLALAATFGGAMLAIGVGSVLLVYLPVIVLASWIGNWLFYVQHQFEGTYWRRSGAWSFHDAALHGGSYFKLPAVLQWFSGNIGLHHVHHLCSRIPNYHLQTCLDRNPDLNRLTTTISLRASIGCWRLALWDEHHGMLVRFSDVGRRRP